MVRRIYQWVLAVLLLLGTGTFGAATVVFFHDRKVTEEDRQCLARTTNAESPDARAGAARRCHLSFLFDPRGFSTRAWLLVLTPEDVGVSLLAFLPALSLWSLSKVVGWFTPPVH